MDGVLLIDKPEGLTSHRVVSILRKKLNIKKIGHAGTLDPAATGLLVCCVGKATKISSLLMGHDKIYTTDVLLGKTSSTYDGEGEISETQCPLPKQNMITQSLENFIGTIKQKPPIYSAIKKDGKKLYEYARAGVDVKIQSRDVTIHNIKLELFDPKQSMLKLWIACEKGTYIRSLAHDLGQILGCGGYAHNIRRLASGEFNTSQALTLQDLDSGSVASIAKKMISIFHALKPNLPLIQVTPEEAQWIRHGKSMDRFETHINTSADLKTKQPILFHTHTHEAIALARLENNFLSLRRVF